MFKELIDGVGFFNLIVWGGIFFTVIVRFFKSICLVPQRTVYVVERLGKYHKTLGAGFHALIPFVDRVAFIQDLKEQTIDVPPQDCFSKDEVNVIVDGVLYISIIDPAKASYGVTQYAFAAVQLAQTTTRAVIGTIDLDRTFEERDLISRKVVEVVEKAGETWGIRVHRYEIKNIQPPTSVRNSMEKQVTAERDRRAILAKSEGDKQSRINESEGRMRELINISEGEMQRRINNAEGKAEEIITLAQATADGIKKMAKVVSAKGGEDAIKLKMSQKYFSKIGNLADAKTKVIIPANLTDYKAWLKNLELTID